MSQINNYIRFLVLFSIKIISQNSDYHPRFGFIPASTSGINPPFEVPDDVFMALELIHSSLNGKQGTAEYPEEYGDA